jgi:hypothetical protein
MARIKTTRNHRRMQTAILRLTSKLPGRWSAMALTEALCSDTKSTYGGRNPYGLVSTTNCALLRLVEMGYMERKMETTDLGRVRYTYAITAKGRVAEKEFSK